MDSPLKRSSLSDSCRSSILLIFPIENAWSKIKQILRSFMARNDPDLAIARFGRRDKDGVRLAVRDFFVDKPEKVSLLLADDYTHGYFRKG